MMILGEDDDVADYIFQFGNCSHRLREYRPALPAVAWPGRHA
jgi:hypothetical protein